MKILVTGGAGFIGSNVVELLIQKGARVFCLDNFSHADFKNLDGLNCEVVCKDILDEAVFKILPRLDGIIHEAAVTDTTLADDTKMVQVNFEGFRNILRYCLKTKTKLIYASSAGVYGSGPSPMKESQLPQPLNTYGYSKLLCDRQTLSLSGKKNIPPLIGLRYFNVYGPREYHKAKSASMIYQLYLQMKAGQQPRIFKFGEQKRDHIYVKDVAAATVKALELKRSHIINVGTGTARSFNDIISTINSVMGTNLKPSYFDNPYTQVYQNHTEADAGRLSEVLKFKARYSLEEGIRDYLSRYLLEP